LIHCPLSKLDPEIIPSWNLPEKKLQQRIGPGEIGHALPWDQLTPEQREFQPQKMAVHAAAIHRIDIEIGNVVEKLKALGYFENTIIFFLSDNGASAEQMIRGDGHDRNAAPGSAKSFLCIGPGWSSAANAPFRLHKSWVHEGGITTPLIVHWPQGIHAHDELRDNPGHVVDLAPTIVELAGGELQGKATTLRSPRAAQNALAAAALIPKRPGKSLVPVFLKDNTVKHDSLWWYHEGNRAIRIGDWKLVTDHDNAWELYNLRTDRSESTDLASQYPDKVQKMQREWHRQTDLITNEVKAERKNEK
jgi:arylsulfatase A-like enzyme